MRPSPARYPPAYRHKQWRHDELPDSHTEPDCQRRSVLKRRCTSPPIARTLAFARPTAWPAPGGCKVPFFVQAAALSFEHDSRLPRAASCSWPYPSRSRKVPFHVHHQGRGPVDKGVSCARCPFVCIKVPGLSPGHRALMSSRGLRYQVKGRWSRRRCSFMCSRPCRYRA